MISRFVDREFRLDVDGARAEYLWRAARALDSCDWRALAFALMSSHVHWALQAGQRSSAALIKPLHVGFAAWLNKREGRLGPVFAERHRTLTFESDTAAALIAYIHNNPVRAGLVSDPADSSWTTHRAYVGLEPAPAWLDVKLGLHLCGFAATASGRLAFHDMVRARVRDPKSLEVSAEDLPNHRRRARAQAGAPVEIATPTACAGVEGLELHVPVITPTLCSLRRRWDGDPTLVLERIEQATGLSRAELQSKRRPRSISEARRLALLVWTHELNRPAIEMAHLLGLSSSSAAGLTSSASATTRELATALSKTLLKPG